MDATDIPSPDDLVWAADNGITPEAVSTGKDWYALLRSHQGRMDLVVQYKIAVDSSDFPQDSLFCEWGYLLDERTNEVVILEGFNTVKSNEAPYCAAAYDADTFSRRYSNNSVYFGCSERWRGSVTQFLDIDMDAIEGSDEEDVA